MSPVQEAPRKPFSQRHPMLMDVLTLGGSVRREIADVKRHNREVKNGPDTGVFSVALNGINTPLQLRAIAAQNSDFARDLSKLITDGTLLEYREYVRTPDQLREQFNELATQNGDLRRHVATSLVEGKHVGGEEALVAQVREQIKDFMRISSPTDDPEVQAAVEKLNTALDADRKRHALSRLLGDRSEDEKGKVGTTSTLAVLAGIGAGVLNLFGQAGLAMALAGQLDDILGAISVGFTENGGKKNLLKIITDNKVTWLGVGAAVAADLFILPGAFAAASGVGALALASMGYWATATAGSMITEATNFVRNAKNIHQKDKAGELPGKTKVDEALLPVRNRLGFQLGLRALKPEQRVTDFVAKQLEKAKMAPEVKVAMLQTIEAMENQDRAHLIHSLKRTGPIHTITSAFEETLSNPYRSWLFKGLGVSLVGSLAAGLGGLLPGKGLLTAAISRTGPAVHNFIHGFTEAFIGPAETYTAVVGSNAEESRYDKNRRNDLLARTNGSSRRGQSRLAVAA